MRKTKELNSKHTNNNGITLIALIITIIVMLILVAVTISMAVNGGLFEYAGKAAGEMQNAIDEEQALANGGIQIGGVYYNSIDEYLGTTGGNTGGVTIPEGIKVGDYVNYTPTTGTYTVASGTNGSGYTSDQTFTTETEDSALQWRILSIDEETGEIELVSATAGQTLYLQGADGYNHAVDILNDLCESLYSNENGATARSINVEDINAKTTYDYSTFLNYGTVYTLSSKDYPNIYASELGSTVNGLEETADLLEVSDRVEAGTVNADGVTEYTKYTGLSTASTLYATYTYYNYFTEDYLADLAINTAPPGLIDVDAYYYLASRAVGVVSR